MQEIAVKTSCISNIYDLLASQMHYIPNRSRAFGFNKVNEICVQDNWHKKKTNISIWYD